MAQDRIALSEPIPEADLLEQQDPLEPSLTEDEHSSVDRGGPPAPVNDADHWEQQLPVPSAEDAYPHDGFEAG